jgi:hypothetical protein
MARTHRRSSICRGARHRLATRRQVHRSTAAPQLVRGFMCRSLPARSHSCHQHPRDHAVAGRDRRARGSIDHVPRVKRSLVHRKQGPRVCRFAPPTFVFGSLMHVIALMTLSSYRVTMYIRPERWRFPEGVTTRDAAYRGRLAGLQGQGPVRSNVFNPGSLGPHVDVDWCLSFRALQVGLDQIPRSNMGVDCTVSFCRVPVRRACGCRACQLRCIPFVLTLATGGVCAAP